MEMEWKHPGGCGVGREGLGEGGGGGGGKDMRTPGLCSEMKKWRNTSE